MSRWRSCISIWTAFCECLAPIFPPGRESAADVPLGLVPVQQPAHLAVELGTQTRETLGQVLVDGGLADPENRSRGADGGFMFEKVHGQVADPFLDVVAQTNHSLCTAAVRCAFPVSCI